MSKRLRLARELLTDNGVVFVSIDDNEQANLKLLMDDVFGEENFIANIIRKTSYGSKTSKPRIDKHHDYLLTYSKDIKTLIEEDVLKGEEKKFDDYSNPDNDINGCWRKDTPLIKIDSGRYGYARYPIYNKYLDITHYPPVYYNEKDRRQWHYVEDTFRELEKNNQVVYYKNEDYQGEYSFYIKKYKKDIINKHDNISTLEFASNDFVNARGTSSLKDILGSREKSFNYPKPVELISKIVQYSSNKNATVLDFFAGSGTTGQAVMELNKEDGGNRRFILCTNNENNICEDVTYERNKRVITGKWATGDVEPVPNNLSYYKIDITNKNDISFKDKKRIDTKNRVHMLTVKDELKIDEANDDYVILSKGDSKTLFIANEILNDKVRELNIDDFDKVHAPAVSSRDKFFKGVDETKVVYY